VALVALGGFAVLRARRQGATTVQERSGPALWTRDQPSPKTPAPETSRAASPLPHPEPKARLVVRLRCSEKPVADVAFTLFEEATHHQEQFSTGPDGAFAILGLPAGEYHIAVDHPDYVFATANPVIEEDQAQELVIDLDRGGRLEGTVTDSAGRPLEGTHVYFLDPKRAAPIGHNLEAHTDVSGNYRISSIPVGLYDVRYRHTGHRGGRKENLAVTGKGQEFRIDMVLWEGQSISGRVVSQDVTPIPGAIVVGSNEETSTCRSDPEGAFSLLGLGGGPASCFASAPGYGPVYLKALAPGSSGVEFRLGKAAEVLGQINSQPLPDRFSVRLSRFDQDLGKYIPLYTRSYEGASGNDFRITEIPAGRYRLEVDAAGYETQDVLDLELSAGQSLTGVQVRLRRMS